MTTPQRKVWDTSPGTYSVRVDEPSPTVTYVGEAHTGVPSSAALWRIKRLTESGSELLIEWADGDDNFNNIWDDRASLAYA